MVHKVFIQSAENQINSWTLINLNLPQKNWPKTSLLHRCCCCTWRDSNCKHVCCCCWQDLECSSSLTVGIAAAQWKVQWSAAILNMEEDHPLQVSSDSQNEKSLVLERIVCCNLPACGQSSHCIYLLLKNSASDMICLLVKSATDAHAGHWSEF